MEDPRIDKYLWSVRLYKTRTEAAEACKSGKVKAGGQNVKPARVLRPGELLEVRKGAVRFTYRVKGFPPGRVGAKLVENYLENLTPQSELDKLSAPIETVFTRREGGQGRPTKKDRRDMESLLEGFVCEDYSLDEEDEA